MTAASKLEISNWFDRGVAQGATHMLVVCDTYDYEDFPVYVMPNEDAHKEYDKRQGHNMQRVMEVYNLGWNKDVQLNSYMVKNFY